MSGLLDEDPERDRFLHPVQYCYDNVSEECSINLCAEDGFINCAHCPLTLCFNHFFIGNHFHGDDDIWLFIKIILSEFGIQKHDKNKGNKKTQNEIKR